MSVAEKLTSGGQETVELLKCSSTQYFRERFCITSVRINIVLTPRCTTPTARSHCRLTGYEFQSLYEMIYTSACKTCFGNSPFNALRAFNCH